MKGSFKTALVILALLLAQAVLSIIAVGLFWRLLLDGDGMPAWFSKLWPTLLVLVLVGLLFVGLVDVLAIGIKALAEYLERRRILRTCRIKGHEWDGCKCRRCGEIRDAEHDWDGCKCRSRWKTRDEGHGWDICVCRHCGKKRNVAHDWNGCKCRHCGEIRDEGHQWVVEVCEQCSGTGYAGHSLSYGDPGYGDPDYQGDPCDCRKPRRTYCTICGREQDES